MPLTIVLSVKVARIRVARFLTDSFVSFCSINWFRRGKLQRTSLTEVESNDSAFLLAS